MCMLCECVSVNSRRRNTGIEMKRDLDVIRRIHPKTEEDALEDLLRENSVEGSPHCPLTMMVRQKERRTDGSNRMSNVLEEEVFTGESTGQSISPS